MLEYIFGPIFFGVEELLDVPKESLSKLEKAVAESTTTAEQGDLQRKGLGLEGPGKTTPEVPPIVSETRALVAPAPCNEELRTLCKSLLALNPNIGGNYK